MVLALGGTLGTRVSATVLLVPGFLGFQTLGRLPYFVQAAEVLEAGFRREGVAATVQAVRQLPTSSLRARAGRLAELVSALPGDGPIHLVGHSTGGLDSRLFLTPNASITAACDVVKASARVHSVTTICTPHYGTPLAAFFVGVHGQRILRLLSVLTIRALKLGRGPLGGILRTGRVLLWIDELIRLDRTILRQLYEELLDDLPEELASEVELMLDDMSGDQSLLEQLTPAALDLLNAGTDDRPGVRYASIVASAPAPGLRSVWRVGRDPYAQLTHAIYQILHRVSRNHPIQRVPPLTAQQAASLTDAYGKVPSRRANDGMVPVLSQVWGRVIHAAHADHLDVMGYFREPGDDRHVDWLASGAGFRRAGFEALWRTVASFIAASPASKRETLS